MSNRKVKERDKVRAEQELRRIRSTQSLPPLSGKERTMTIREMEQQMGIDGEILVRTGRGSCEPLTVENQDQYLDLEIKYLYPGYHESLVFELEERG